MAKIGHAVCPCGKPLWDDHAKHAAPGMFTVCIYCGRPHQLTGPDCIPVPVNIDDIPIEIRDQIEARTQIARWIGPSLIRAELARRKQS